MSLRRIHAVAWVEGLYLARDRTSLALLMSVPLLQILLFGFAVNPDPRTVTAVIEGGRPADRARVEKVLAQSGYFRPAQQTSDALEAVRRGDALIGIRLPDPGDPFELEEEARAETETGAEADAAGPARIFADASNPAAVTPALGALARTAWRQAARTGLRPPPPDIVWLYNPERLSSWSMIPGLMGLVLMISMLMLGSLSLLRERESGALETLETTPVGRLDLLAGKALPHVATAMFQAGAITGIAVTLFELPLRGPVLFLAIMVPVFALAHLALGFWLSDRARSQLQAVQGAVAFYLPAILLSGVLFPYEGMPAWARGLGEVFPLTHMVRAMRGLFLRGDGWDVLSGHIWPVALFAGVFTGLCLMGQFSSNGRFSRRQ
ncbi:ABC transporter permease [Eilatimonas milleporae]|uniref:ABC-2 type transport system permease protein n=1 Tax=Eilatimonas milleporae TaxID=911205 RepID=A0A3M0CCY8_9PROT|nr:ABC transporter permease [Eilatimonas milleporae]RMB04869.1 ABC-2 type transport system permease protein [Eilatimonas milleporae]